MSAYQQTERGDAATSASGASPADGTQVSMTCYEAGSDEGFPDVATIIEDVANGTLVYSEVDAGTQTLNRCPVSQATASTLLVGGPYGTEEGCARARSLDFDAVDTMLYVSQDGIDSMEGSCELQLGTNVTLACSGEGDQEWSEVATIIENVANGTLAYGEVTLNRCD